jgi:holo-[acyl-carrier protein] synthase
VALRRQPLLDGLSGRVGRPAGPLYPERLSERGNEPLECQLAVPQLAPLVFGDRPHDRAGARNHTRLLGLGQRGRGLDVEQRLDPRLRLLRMLTAGAARSGRAETDLGAPDRDAPRDWNPVRTRLARDDVNSARSASRDMRVGVDLIEIERVRRTLARYADFPARCFTEAERAYCDSRPNPAQHYAARFAGKEAVGKALGFGVAVHFAWREIEIAGRPKPSVRLSGRLRERAELLGAGEVELSMTHSKELAAAVAVVDV